MSPAGLSLTRGQSLVPATKEEHGHRGAKGVSNDEDARPSIRREMHRAVSGGKATGKEQRRAVRAAMASRALPGVLVGHPACRASRPLVGRLFGIPSGFFRLPFRLPLEGSGEVRRKRRTPQPLGGAGFRWCARQDLNLRPPDS